MSRDAGGNYSLPVGNPVIPGTVITTAWANGTMDDLAAAITDSLSRSGKGGMTAPLDMGANRITGVAAATVGTDAPQAVQVRNGAFSWLFPVSSDAGGNAYTGTALLPDAPVGGTVFFFLTDKVNTGPMTLSVNGGPAYPLLVNTGPVPAGLIVTSMVLSVAFYANSYRVLGGVSGDSYGVTAVNSSDPQMIAPTLSNKIINLLLKSNIPNGMVKLGADGLIPVGLIPTQGLNYIGVWSAAPGTNPSPASSDGDFYVISVAGNLTLYRSSVPPAYTPQVTAVVPGDQIVWTTPGTVDQPQGWYYIGVSSATIASSVGLTATPTFPAATNVQSWANAVDPYLGTLLPKAGGTLTGPLILNGAPATALTASTRQYVDDKFASIPVSVASFNTRTGAVTLLSADVTTALAYTPLNKAGDTMGGNLNLANNNVSNNKTVTYNAQIGVTPTTGAVAVDFTTGQKQKLTMTGIATLSFAFPGVGHYQLVLVSGAFAVTWPAIGAAWQWLNATAAPTLNTGTYGGVVSIFWDGVMAIASYNKIGAV